MRKLIVFIVNIVAITVLVWHFLVPTVPAKPKLPPSEFAFTDLSGQAHHLKDFKGKIVLIHFWASWCAPCVEEFPQLMVLAKQTPEKLQIIALSVDESEEVIRKFIGKRDVPGNMLLVWDKNKKISYDQFQTLNYPETILIGCDYKMHHKVIGMAEDWPATIAPLLRDCAAQTIDSPR